MPPKTKTGRSALGNQPPTMNRLLRQKRLMWTVLSGLAVLAVAYAGGHYFHTATAAAPIPKGPLMIPRDGTPERRGYTLFMQNCTHCHGTDARGGEGPNLQKTKKTDALIAATIKNGIKGEMPKFGAKFTEAEVQSLIVFIHSLRLQE
jgi:hypothetical protein